MVPLGGEQSSKLFLDSVVNAVIDGDLLKLESFRIEFLSIPDNATKCRDNSGNTLAHLAVGKDISVLQFVLDELLIDINGVNDQGKTPLHEAVRNNYVDCTRFLLTKGARDDVACNTLSTPFHTAAACGSVECMGILLDQSSDAKARVNEVDKNRATALLKCTYDGDLRVVQWLLAHGADCEAKDIGDNTPLLVATMRGREDIVDVLLERNVQVNVRDCDGNTAIHHCASRCLPSVCEKLIERGAQVVVQNNQRCSPLHFAAIHARPESSDWHKLVLLLVRFGGDQLLRQENNNKKKPEDLVQRSLRSLFCVKEVQRHRETLERQQVADQQKTTDRLSSHMAAIDSQRQQQMSSDAALREEEERCAKEAEERLRHEYEVRARIEEVAEQQRLEAEEAARAKKEASLKKSKGKK